MFLKLFRKASLKALASFSFFTTLAFFATALIFNLISPPAYGQANPTAWNLHRVTGNDLNFYYGTGGANALILKSSGDMQARIMRDIDNPTTYFVDPNGNTNLNALGIGITSPFYKLQTSSGFAKTDTTLRLLGMFGSNEGTNSWGLKIAMTGAPTTAASTLNLQTGDNASNNGRLGLQSFGGNVGIGTTAPLYKFNLQGGHGDTQALLHSTGNGTSVGEADLFIWASEPGCTWDGAGIGNNIYNNTQGCNTFPRISTARGGSYMRLLNNAIELSTMNPSGTLTQSLYTTDGLVGIGTLPFYKLHVAGTGAPGTILSRMVHTGSAGSPGTALQVSNGYPLSQGAGTYEVFGVYANNFAENLFSIRDSATIVLPEFSNASSNRFYGFMANNAVFADGTPYYFGIGREPGTWTKGLLIANHTGIKLVAHGGYGGVAIHDNYNYTTATWPGIGTEVARFRVTPAGGSYFNSSLGINMTAGTPYGLQVGGTAGTTTGAVKIDGILSLNGYAPNQCASSGVWGLCVGGTSGGQSVWNNTSDVRLKENITPIPNALDKVVSLRGVYFNFKDLDGVYKTLPKGRQVGFIAQEVEPVLPEVITTGGDGMKMMGYGSITALLTEATKELNEKLEKQQAENKQLKEDLELLKKEIQLIKEKQ